MNVQSCTSCGGTLIFQDASKDGRCRDCVAHNRAVTKTLIQRALDRFRPKGPPSFPRDVPVSGHKIPMPPVEPPSGRCHNRCKCGRPLDSALHIKDRAAWVARYAEAQEELVALRETRDQIERSLWRVLHAWDDAYDSISGLTKPGPMEAAALHSKALLEYQKGKAERA